MYNVEHGTRSLGPHKASISGHETDKQLRPNLMVMIGGCVTYSGGHLTQTGGDQGSSPEKGASAVDQDMRCVS